MDSINQEHMECMTAFPPPHADNLDFPFDSSQDDWTIDAFGLKTRSCPSPMGQVSFAQIPNPALPVLEPMLDNSTEERVESVMRHAQATGFDTFEDIATAYYKTNFKDSSALSTGQHSSHSKRFSRVISDVYQATESWPQWDRRGFREEILDTAMAMLNAEASGKGSQLASALQNKGASSVSESLQSMKKTVQQEVRSAPTRSRWGEVGRHC